LFCGGLKSIKNLPKSATNVFLTLICDKNNVGHDPSLQYLEETLPHLICLSVKIGPYSNLEKLSKHSTWMPSWKERVLFSDLVDSFFGGGTHHLYLLSP